MSRIGRIPIPIPKEVTVTVDGNTVACKGPLGEMTYTADSALTIHKEDESLVVERGSDDRRDKSLHGLARSLLSNMIEGVSKGFQKTLEIRGTGYRAALQGKDLNLTVGYSHPVVIEAPEGISFEVPNNTTVTVKGYDKQIVGQVAARIREVREPEPYLGKGIRYQNERIRRKEGKTAK